MALLGSRQVGKTTLARSLQLQKPIHYMDLERPSDLAKLEDPELYLSRFPGHLIILDEIQRLPTLFPLLRSLIDARRHAGEPNAQFLLLGSASRDLLQASSESLAGRISYLELPPFLLPELDRLPSTVERHWHRGGYPGSYLAPNDETSLQWRSDFLSTYTEAYLPQQGVQSSPQQLRRLCSMLAHQQGATLNLSRLGASLALDGKTVRHYIDLLEGLFLLRTLPPWGRNAGKRLVQSPKLYWRDSGLLHALAGLPTLEHVMGHPLCGHSWEGYCIEQILALLPTDTRASHYRTHAGAEVDLVLEAPSGEVTCIEIKRTVSPKLSPGFNESFRTIAATRGFIVTPSGGSFPLSEKVEAISLADFITRLPGASPMPAP